MRLCGSRNETRGLSKRSRGERRIEQHVHSRRPLVAAHESLPEIASEVVERGCRARFGAARHSNGVRCLSCTTPPRPPRASDDGVELSATPSQINGRAARRPRRSSRRRALAPRPRVEADHNRLASPNVVKPSDKIESTDFICVLEEENCINDPQQGAT